MSKFTPEQQTIIDEINKMGHYEMAKLWRYGEAGHPYFDTKLPYFSIFQKRFRGFGGLTKIMSKSIGETS